MLGGEASLPGPQQPVSDRDGARERRTQGKERGAVRESPHRHTHTPRGGGRPRPRVAEESPEACGEQVGMGSPAREAFFLGRLSF